MAQRPVSKISELPEAVGSASADQAPVVRRSAELRLERSRFSRLLARFGLGELTDPILRPIERAAEKSRAR